jgi:hypothetical protein
MDRFAITLDDVKTIATIAGIVIAAIALVKTLIEYRHQGTQKRAEHFITMRRRFKENPAFTELCDLLEDDDPKLAELPFKSKRDFIGFFEEVAIMLNSGLIRLEVAHYMFGYYVLDCWRSESFWKGIDRNNNYVAVFKDLAFQMEKFETSFVFDRHNYRI